MFRSHWEIYPYAVRVITENFVKRTVSIAILVDHQSKEMSTWRILMFRDETVLEWWREIMPMHLNAGSISTDAHPLMLSFVNTKKKRKKKEDEF